MFGKIYSMYSVKVVLLVSIFLFEVGSAICGAAPNSIAFIIGRAVAGVGAAGILGGSVSAVSMNLNQLLTVLLGCDHHTYCSSEKTTSDERPAGCGLRNRHNPRAFDRWGAYIAYDMEMVLLYQPAHWWRGDDRPGVHH